MKRAMVWVGLAVLILALAGCRNSERLVTEKDDGRTVKMRIGEKLLVQLEGNPTTGYEWSLAALNEKYLSYRGEPEFQRDSNLIGAGGTYTFIFDTLEPGRTTLTLEYARPFEPDVPPARTFSVDVLIR
ncbi:MAG: inhibitor of cysteine peptidase [Chloroflexota bacterium]|nr:inhibitor of cysteine peptidase [Chloroflexota bacterium]